MPFNKDFGTLYNIAMAMADNCIGPITVETFNDRVNKLNEEYNELLCEFNSIDIARMKKTLAICTLTTGTEVAIANMNRLKDELGDVLFVLLHIAHFLELTPHQILHTACMKMLKRVNDPNYIAKN